ncbi:YJR054W and PRM6 (YML047C) [Zygosaccharomyces parabailii]|nr:YJR054W and PRM6 (YML047C) [Zygosaccharomyces parabailii]CDH09181.1 uncharacterized protein ZBAI_00965 [Zygosaccharomyces bailii ISA1307]
MFRNDWKYSINAKTFDSLDTSLFRNTKFWTVLNCIILVWGLTILKVLLFASDIYTCIKLLAFNSWSNNIVQPYLPFRISKWLFSGCILASVVLLIWELICGIRIYRTRNISLTYVNNFSRTAYSISDYSKYCVYFKITPKGQFQKVAFFTFFELKDCLRLLFADTPRQVINGLTLWSVLITVDSENSSIGDGHLESFMGVISKIKTIAQTNHEEAVLLSFMLFSFVIWAIFITKLAVAMLMAVYVYYKLIQGHEHGGLKEFVCVTINRNVDTLLEKQKKKRGLNSEPYKIGSLSKSSVFEEDIENKAAMSMTEASLGSLPNDSTTALMDPKDTHLPQQHLNDTHILRVPTTGSWDSKYEQTADLSQEPLQTTSMIIDPDHRGKIFTLDVAKHLRRDGYNVLAMSSSDYLESNDTFVPQQPNKGRKNSSLSKYSRRPKPPILSDPESSIQLAQDDSMESQQYERIYTPLRAYTREGEHWMESRHNRFPERYSSLLDRRDRMANEDYNHYISRHKY